MPRLPLRLIILPLVLVVCGCVSIGGYPDRPESVTEKLRKLQELYFLPAKDVLADFDGQPDGEKREYRDMVVHGRLLALDLQYGVFQEAIYREGIVSNLSIDVLGVAVGAAGAAVSDADTSKLLSALSGGISGTGTAINKNVYYERTLPALLALMDAKRDEVRAEILGGLTLNHLEYPLGRALADLERYLQAGTIPGAIAEVLATAGETKARAESQIDIVRSEVFATARAQAQVDELISLANDLGDSAAAEILQNPPSEIDGNTLRAVKARLGGTDLSQASSVFAEEPAKAKEILKMLLVLLANREQENLENWEAAMQSLKEQQ